MLEYLELRKTMRQTLHSFFPSGSAAGHYISWLLIIFLALGLLLASAIHALTDEPGFGAAAPLALVGAAYSPVRIAAFVYAEALPPVECAEDVAGV